MIRKNQRPASHARCRDYQAGVDLNRNYGYKFAYDAQGSSNNECSEIFRGAHPFSEPETQAIRNFVSWHSDKKGKRD